MSETQAGGFVNTGAKGKRQYSTVKTGEADGYTLYTLTIDGEKYENLNLVEIIDILEWLED